MTAKALTNGLELVDPAYYGEHGPPHDVWRELRAEDPIHWCDNPVYLPFWAITKHADIMEISSRPDTFLNEPGIVLMPRDHVVQTDGIGAMRTIIQMDPPEHRDYRKVASGFFTPRSIQQIEEATIESARSIVDRLAGDTGEGEGDWAVDVAAAHPLRVLSTILGVPREQEPTILKLTNQLFAADDDELQRPAADRETALMELGMELYGIFDAIINERRAHPTDDLASVIANGKVNGEDMGPMETFGYCLIAFTAGHDTTKNSLAGGLHAFIEHPDQLAALKANPDLLATAVDEVVRYATPVNYMMRTVAHDVEFRGRQFKQGDRLVQFYASANRDEDVFDDPYSFRIDRQGNRQLGFGIGEHFCMGAHLARMSQRALFREFANRLEHVELIDEPKWIKSSFVVGYKHLPVRYRFSK